jgi:hypothetical protein
MSPSNPHNPACREETAHRSLARMAAGTLLFFLLIGCDQGAKQNTSTGDPALDARLTQLTKELHHAMMGRSLNRNFDEFVALHKLDVPPPPPGKKYAINERWKVVVVDQK